MPTSPSPPLVPAPQQATFNLSTPPSKPAEATGIKFQVSHRPTFPSSQHDGRRPSVQFATHASESILRSESPKPSRPKLKVQQRLTSPPPPTKYESRVSFDTFDNRDATDFSFTLRSKHKDYTYTKRSRTFLCGTDQNDYSEFALEWLLDELVDDGDEVVCLRVVDKDNKINSDSSIEEGRYKAEANKLMEHIQLKNDADEKTISLVLEFAVGKVQETIQRMISIYEPACLIVGTRGRSLGGIQGLLPGSVSKYCLQNSPVPVIVVRPSEKREKKKLKRRADPTRRAYMEILAKGGVTGSQILDKVEGDRLAGHITGEASETEARAVAQALGLPIDYSEYRGPRRESEGVDPGEGAPLGRVISGKSDYTSGPESPSPVGGLSPDEAFQDEMRSPELDDLESPELSEAEEEGEKDTRSDIRSWRKSSADSTGKATDHTV